MANRWHKNTEIRRLLINNEFSYQDAGKEMGHSRQAMQSLCHTRNLCDWVKKGKEEIRKKRLLKVRKVFEDCHFDRKKAALKMGIDKTVFNKLLNFSGFTNYRKRSAEDCVPRCLGGNFTVMKKEADFFEGLKFTIEKQLDISITNAELLVVLIEFGKIDTQITIHHILENRRRLYGLE